MRDDRLSVLWLCGPPGAGKSAVGWALYDGLARAGARAGFVDIDQLGMCLPAPADDPERFGLKERSVSAVAANFRAAGCGALVVSGDLGLSTAISPRVACHAHGTTLRDFLPRGWDHPVASYGTTRRVVPVVPVAFLLGCLQVVGLGGSGGWCFGRSA